MTLPILIVDDSLTVRMDLREAFEDAGLRPVDCDTVAAAREALRETAFGVVILDVLLPDGDGVSLLAEIRESARNSRVPVMLLSTEAEVRDRVRGLAHGADEYVGKPYDPAYVVARVKEMLSRGAPEPPADGRHVVLHIDDSPSCRARLAEGLEAAGYQVIAAETGERGLRLAAEMRPDAIVVNEVLPGIDGLTVLRRIKLDATLRRTPVVLLTGSERPEDEVRALEAGADAFFRKHEQAGALVARLAKMLRGSDRGRRDVEPTPSSLGPKRILLVDDDAVYLERLAAELRHDGYDLVLARCGQEALDLLSVQRVDCVLLDLVMPDLSGDDTCRRIRASPGIADVPVIVVTAADDAHLIESVNAGADDFVTKSSDFDVLRARVRAQLRRRLLEDERRDISERLLRQEREAAEARAAQELAEVRAALLADLERKNDELREADRRKNEFLGILSHELRNPLAALRNALWILERSEPDGDRARHARKVFDRQVAHLTGLVDDLLDLTRISRGKIQLQRCRLDLADLLRRAAEDHEGLLAEREIELHVAVAPEPIAVDADPTRIVQIVGNLLQNCAKFTDRGGRVALSMEREGDEAAIRVADTGVGIAPEMLPRLFEPFAQANETLQRSDGGLGLGLALVKGLVELHGGRVEGRSEGLGRGSEFTVRLPVASGFHPRAHSPAADEPPPSTRRVLIIDDNVDAAETLREVLQMAGHVVEIAHDGRTGVEKAMTFRPDVSLCDIGLPIMDGYEVARALRAEPALASMTLVAFTGYARPDDQRRAAEAGFDAHLSKPATMEDIQRALSLARRAHAA